MTPIRLIPEEPYNMVFIRYFYFNSNILINVQNNIKLLETNNSIKSMQIKDFQGMRKYKMIIPIITICSWLALWLGPIYFQTYYSIYILLITVYIFSKAIKILISLALVNRKADQIYTKYGLDNKISKTPSISICMSQNLQQYDVDDRIEFAFIIPNYNEPIEVLRQTLDVFAKHKRSSEYIILLAMQDHEKYGKNKAQTLIGQYKKKFRLMDATYHKLREGEIKGKASNISWCAQHLEQKFKKHNIDSDKVMLTFIDSDSWTPQPFVSQIQQYLRKNPERIHLTVFQASQIFTRNNLKVPAITRILDLINTELITSNFISLSDFSLAVSNYTLSYKFLKNQGYFDTCADAIAEDMHITYKSYWKSLGELKVVPIHVPFNQLCLQSDKGYCHNVIARFWQAQRHNQGVRQFAYNLKQFVHQPFLWKHLIVLESSAESFIIGSALWPPVMLYQFYYSSPFAPVIESNILFTSVVIFNIVLIMKIFLTLLFERFKRRASKILFNLQTQPLYRMLEPAIMFWFVLVIYIIPTFLIAAFTSPCQQREFRVSQKMSIPTQQDVNIIKLQSPQDLNTKESFRTLSNSTISSK